MTDDFDLENLFKEAEKTVEKISQKKKEKSASEVLDGEGVEKSKEELLKEISILNYKLDDVRREFSNFKERTIREKEKLSVIAESEVLKEVINIIDIFDYAKKTFTNGESHTVEEYQKGFNLLYREFMKILSKMGVKKIKAVGEKFNPHFHHVVTVVESDKGEEGIVAEEIKGGYVYKGMVIRPSMVKVFKSKK